MAASVRWRRLQRFVPLVLPLLAVWVTGCSSSSSNVDDEGKYPLWKIEGEENTIWLLGSVHLLPESAHPFPESFDDAYEDADRVIFEVNLDMDNMMGSMMGMMSKLMLPPGETLEDHLEPETWELLEPRLDEVAEQLGEMMGGTMGANVPMDGGMLKQALVRMKPWFVGMMLQQSSLDVKDYRPDLGVDMFYATKAKEDGKKTSGLETIEEQMSFLESVSDVDPDQFIRSTLEQTVPEVTTIDDLVDAWKNGDLERLDRLMNEGMKESPEFYDLLLVQRNKNWVPQIIDLMNDDENYLIVVGAGHLVGKDSVVELLRKRGIRVERI